MVVGEVTYKTLKEERYGDASPVCYFNGLGDGFGTATAPYSCLIETRRPSQAHLSHNVGLGHWQWMQWVWIGYVQHQVGYTTSKPAIKLHVPVWLETGILLWPLLLLLSKRISPATSVQPTHYHQTPHSIPCSRVGSSVLPHPSGSWQCMSHQGLPWEENTPVPSPL